jgi:hypothetical protein
MNAGERLADPRGQVLVKQPWRTMANPGEAASSKSAHQPELEHMANNGDGLRHNRTQEVAGSGLDSSI